MMDYDEFLELGTEKSCFTDLGQGTLHDYYLARAGDDSILDRDEFE